MSDAVSATGRTPRVALFVTCLANVFRPAVAEASVELLRAAGCEVHVPLDQSCCGQPGYNSGAIASARPVAQGLIRTFEAFDYVVAPSGSCAGMIVHHYPRLFADDPHWHPRALALAGRTFEISTFLAEVVQFTPPPAASTPAVTYHDSCAGLRELGVRNQPRQLLSAAGVTVTEMQGTEVCCGFGGTFCAKLPEISAAMADEKLGNALATGSGLLLGGDLGCLLHLCGRAQATGKALAFRHVVEVLAGRLDTPAIGEDPR
jgi:L-lactate dehydrogenase complex protein LldE